MPTIDAASTTAHALISRALKTLGKLGLGESLDGTLAWDSLVTLNEMLDHWRTQDLLIYHLRPVPVPVTAGKRDYRIGVGCEIDTPVPNRIWAATMKDAATPDIERRLYTLEDREAAGFPYKTLTGAVATHVFFLPHLLAGTRCGQVSLYPTPTTSGTLVLYTLAGLVQFPDLTFEYNLPHGYLKALRYNLAVELAPDHGVEPPAIVYSQARSSLADIKRRNIRHTALGNDAVPRGGAYNIYTDE